MAVIWIAKYGKRYVSVDGSSPGAEDIKNADAYDKILREKLRETEKRLKGKGFYKMNGGLEKWHLLGSELSFLDNLELRKECDPELTLTWRALYDIAPKLAPGSLPTDMERVEGSRNHFLMCYRIAKYKLEFLKETGISWRIFNDICMSFTVEQWKDERLIEWIFIKAKSSGVSAVRVALIVIRRLCGVRSKVQLDTTMLDKKELFARLNAELSTK